MFPVLTSAQHARVLPHGKRRIVEQSEIVVELNEHVTKVFMVVSGQLHVLQASNNQEQVVAICNPGMFTGELNVLSGRRGLVRIRAAEKSELVEIEREALQALVETDTELSDLFLLAFILRRLELIAREAGDIVLISSSHLLDTLRIKEFLTRNYQPYSYIDLERDAEVQEVLDRFSLSIDDLPVLICRGTAVLRNPTNEEITGCLGFNEGIDQADVRDLIIVGAGPAGLAAAVYGASEGLMFWCSNQMRRAVRRERARKQKTTLAFLPVSRDTSWQVAPARRPKKFGADMLIAKHAKGLACDRRPYAVLIGDGQSVPRAR
jgi:thioredoxin reductase (NADPH)